MQITHLSRAQADEAIALWDACELTRPWNEPRSDLLRALEGPASTILAAIDAQALVGTAMVGHDGHRGWVYYLAVDPTRRHQGTGRALMAAAEAWLGESGAPKIQFMVRSVNAAAIDFYTRLGYDLQDCVVMGRRLEVEPMRGARALIEALTLGGWTVATAESLTGGLLAGDLVGVPGASKVFTGGVVAYDTALKHSLLGVDADLLATHGPVNPLVARQMAEGARQSCSVQGRVADLGLATTGVAGPDADPQTGQPAGSVFVGVATAHGSRAVALSLTGDRAAIRTQTVAAAITEALAEISVLHPGATAHPG